MKKIIIYLFIVFLNLILLSSLLFLWTSDCLISKYTWDKGFEILKLFGISFIILISFILIPFLSKRFNKNRIIISCFLTILFSSYKYIQYTYKIITIKILEAEARNIICSKINFDTVNLYASKTTNLTFSEYTIITSVLSNFPEITKYSYNINYEYSFEPTLPDYSIKIYYQIPDSIYIKKYEIRDGNHYEIQTFEITGRVKNVNLTIGSN